MVVNEQEQQLTEQVAALTTKAKSEGTQHCYYCKQPGHTQRYCPVRKANQRCYTCGKPGHLTRDCWQAGKRPGDVCVGQQTSPSYLSPMNTVVVATVKSYAFSIVGKVGGINSEILLDSGSSVCLLSQALVQKLPATESRPLPQLLLQTASGETMAIIDCVRAEIWLPGVKQDIAHTFIVVKDLIAPAIVGVDFFNSTS